MTNLVGIVSSGSSVLAFVSSSKLGKVTVVVTLPSRLLALDRCDNKDITLTFYGKRLLIHQIQPWESSSRQVHQVHLGRPSRARSQSFDDIPE